MYVDFHNLQWLQFLHQPIKVDRYLLFVWSNQHKYNLIFPFRIFFFFKKEHIISIGPKTWWFCLCYIWPMGDDIWDMVLKKVNGRCIIYYRSNQWFVFKNYYFLETSMLRLFCRAQIHLWCIWKDSNEIFLYWNFKIVGTVAFVDLLTL